MILSNVTRQIGVLAMLKHKIKVSGSLFGVYQLNDVFMLDDWEYINFNVNSLELLFGDVFQGYFFYGIFGLLVLFVSFIDDGVGALSDGFIEEVGADFSEFFFIHVACLHKFYRKWEIL